MADHPTSLTADVLAYLRDSAQSPLYGRTAEVVTAWSGDRNALWRVRAEGQDVVLKMFLDAGQARGRRQFNNQETAARLGVAPPPLAFERYPVGLSRQVMLYRWDPGAPLDPMQAEQREQLAHALAAVHTQAPAEPARLSPHPVNPDYQWNLMQGSRRQLESWLASQAPDALTAALRLVLTAAQTQVRAVMADTGSAFPAPVHGDVYPEHCLVDARGLRLVDWEWAGLGDPAREAAHVLLHVLRDIPPPARQAWRERYVALMQDPALSGRIRLYEMMLPVAACLDLALHLPGRVQAASEPAAAHTWLRLAFVQCLADVARVLDLDFARDEVAHIAHVYHTRLGQPAPLSAGAQTP